MLPDLGRLWLTDREGQRYSSELRIIAYDHMKRGAPRERIGRDDEFDPSPFTIA
jgi:hypothetical protein